MAWQSKVSPNRCRPQIGDFTSRVSKVRFCGPEHGKEENICDLI